MAINMKTFEHGGQIEKFVLDLGCDVSEIIDLSSNINFVKPQINIDFNTLDISSIQLMISYMKNSFKL